MTFVIVLPSFRLPATKCCSSNFWLFTATPPKVLDDFLIHCSAFSPVSLLPWCSWYLGLRLKFMLLAERFIRLNCRILPGSVCATLLLPVLTSFPAFLTDSSACKTVFPFLSLPAVPSTKLPTINLPSKLYNLHLSEIMRIRTGIVAAVMEFWNLLGFCPLSEDLWLRDMSYAAFSLIYWFLTLLYSTKILILNFLKLELYLA